jgi:hypothetical protein
VHIYIQYVLTFAHQFPMILTSIPRAVCQAVSGRMNTDHGGVVPALFLCVLSLCIAHAWTAVRTAQALGLRCFSGDPKLRPTFEEIIVQLRLLVATVPCSLTIAKSQLKMLLSGTSVKTGAAAAGVAPSCF